MNAIPAIEYLTPEHERPLLRPRQCCFPLSRRMRRARPGEYFCRNDAKPGEIVCAEHLLTPGEVFLRRASELFGDDP